MPIVVRGVAQRVQLLEPPESLQGLWTVEGWRDEWSDPAWWAGQLGCVSIDDAVLCNHRITLAHYELSMALHAILGPGTGANFHTWAVWGSSKAGTTIRQEDLPGLKLTAAALGSGLGLLGAGRLWPVGVGRGIGLSGGAALGAASLVWLVDRVLDNATRQVLVGNRIVLEDIGRVTADFVDAFRDRPGPDGERLAEFLGTLRPGPTVGGGQDLLASAFRHYYAARHEPDANRRHEQMLLANLQVILHEHIRLQPYIGQAMPRPLRRLVTAHLLNFQAGLKELTVGQDVVAWRGPDVPMSLDQLEDGELLGFLCGEGGWDRTPDSLVGSRARDWSDIRERMNFICDLFRSRHFDPSLFSSPYTDEQRAALLEGRVPLELR